MLREGGTGITSTGFAIICGFEHPEGSWGCICHGWGGTVMYRH